MYESDRKSIIPGNGGDKVKPIKNEENPIGKTKEAKAIEDYFPALQKYKDEHNAANLEKLCVEIIEFCRAVYASTRNEAERKVYYTMVQKLNK
jgi:hypothetical protein